MEPIRLFHWRGQNDFGDRLSPVVAPDRQGGRLVRGRPDPDQSPAFLAAGDLPETIPCQAGRDASRQALRDSFPAELKAH